MQELLSRLGMIQKKLHQLIEEKKTIAQTNKDLKRENERLQRIVSIQNETIKMQEQKLKVKEIIEATLNPDQELSSNKKRELKHKINEMIKEVDYLINQIYQNH